MLIYNAKIFTANPEQPEAESMIIEQGRVTWAGYGRPEYGGETVDMGGKRIVPGFIDAHMHPVMLADYAKQIAVLPPNIHSIKELQEKIKQVREREGERGGWILGWGYDEGKLLEGRSPNRHDLDIACSDVPVVLTRSCMHIRVANSLALQIAGIDRDTPDPSGGEIDRDENGEPTGILRENARYILDDYIPVWDTEAKADNLKELGEHLAKQGIVAVCDLGALDGIDNYPIFERAMEKGFPQSVAMYYIWDFVKDLPGFDIPKEKSCFERQLRIAGLKLISDGSVSGRTAWMNEPYLNGSDYGISTLSDELLDSAIEFVKPRGLQLAVHAMGGRAITRLVSRLSKESHWTGESLPSVRLEHITEPSEETLALASKQGYAFVTQPIFMYCEIESYIKNLGPNRTRSCYPISRILEAGVKTALSTDAPATSWADPSDPFVNIQAACTRRAFDGTDLGADQSIDVRTALRMYTADAADIAGFKTLGRLAPGYDANYLVLDRDILDIPAEEISQVRVLETHFRGSERVFTE